MLFVLYIWKKDKNQNIITLFTACIEEEYNEQKQRKLQYVRKLEL